MDTNLLLRKGSLTKAGRLPLLALLSHGGYWGEGRASRAGPADSGTAVPAASLPLLQLHELADVPGEQLRLLKGSKVAPTGHVGIGDEFRELDLHPLFRRM